MLLFKNIKCSEWNLYKKTSDFFNILGGRLIWWKMNFHVTCLILMHNLHECGRSLCMVLHVLHVAPFVTFFIHDFACILSFFHRLFIHACMQKLIFFSFFFHVFFNPSYLFFFSNSFYIFSSYLFYSNLILSFFFKPFFIFFLLISFIF